jgi:hypothetical protein
MLLWHGTEGNVVDSHGSCICFRYVKTSKRERENLVHLWVTAVSHWQTKLLRRSLLKWFNLQTAKEVGTPPMPQ